jgi:tetratricopeptide (TPR) repeat protein
VAWIPGRNDSLLAALSLAAWLFFVRDRARPSRVDRALHLGLFALALLTKETAIALPLVWLAQAVVVDRARGPAPAFYLSGWALLVGLTGLVHRGCCGIVLPLDPTVLAVPADQTIWAGVLAAAGIAAGARLANGARGRVVAFGMIAFVLLLAPVLAMPGTLVLDSRLYLPACGVVLAIGEIVRAAVFERAPHVAAADGPDPVPARLFVGLSTIVVLVLVGITAGYEASFRDPRAFARAAAAGSPHSALAHFCLGRVYQGDGDDDRALAEYDTSLALGPGEVVHNNIAVIYMAHARWADAEEQLREELALDPRYARAYENLAIVLRREGRPDEALAAAEKARALE